MRTFLKNTILIFTGMVFFVACSKNFNTVLPLEYDHKFPEESARNIEIVSSENARPNFILFAPILNKYTGENSYTDCPKGVKVTSFDENGSVQSVLTSDYAISFDDTELMEARENVVITDLKKKETIETEKIVWDKRNKRIYSDVEIRQTKADGTINIGDGFDADEKFTKYSIRNPRGEVIEEGL